MEYGQRGTWVRFYYEVLPEIGVSTKQSESRVLNDWLLAPITTPKQSVQATNALRIHPSMSPNRSQLVQTILLQWWLLPTLSTSALSPNLWTVEGRVLDSSGHFCLSQFPTIDCLQPLHAYRTSTLVLDSVSSHWPIQQLHAEKTFSLPSPKPNNTFSHPNLPHYEPSLPQKPHPRWWGHWRDL